MRKQFVLVGISVCMFVAGLLALARAQTRIHVPTPVARRAARTYVIPHILEKSGKANSTQYTFDTTIFATYTPGLAGIPAGAGATVDLYLYDQATGSPMKGAGGADVCNPCTFPLGSANRSQAINLEDQINAKGGFDRPIKLGFGILVVGGQDPDGVNLQGFVVNSHTNAFDLSVFGFDPQPITAAQ